RQEEPVWLLLWRKLLRAECLPGRDFAPGDQAVHRFRWNQFPEQCESRTPGRYDRLDPDLLEEPAVWRGADGHAILLSDPSTVVRCHRRAQECSSWHGLPEHSVCFAVKPDLPNPVYGERILNSP